MTRNPDWLLDQLPVGMVQDDFFSRFVSIFQEVASTCLDDIDNLVHVPDPSVAPAPLLPWLGSWVGTRAIDASLPVATQRDLVRAGSETLAWRGTRRGLLPFLDLVSGGDVTLEENGGVWREGEAPGEPPMVEITMGSAGWLPEADLITLVREELPMGVGLRLTVGDELLWPPPEPEPVPEVEPPAWTESYGPGNTVFDDGITGPRPWLDPPTLPPPVWVEEGWGSPPPPPPPAGPPTDDDRPNWGS